MAQWRIFKIVSVLGCIVLQPRSHLISHANSAPTNEFGLRMVSGSGEQTLIVPVHRSSRNTNGEMPWYPPEIICQCSVTTKDAAISAAPMIMANGVHKCCDVRYQGRSTALVDLADVRSCINVSGLCSERVVLRAIMDISARAISLAARPQQAIRVISEVVRALQGLTDCSS